MGEGTVMTALIISELILFFLFLSGDSNKEELLTVEYFKLLNEKNVLIKKQIELNLLYGLHVNRLLHLMKYFVF